MMTMDTRQTLIRRAACTGGLALTAMAAARAATLHVPGSYGTVAAAARASASGDTIAIAPGTFPTNVVFQKSVTLAGADSASTILDGGRAGTVLTTTPGVTLTVRNLTIRNGMAPLSFGFGGGVMNDGDLRMENCVITQCGAPGAGGALSNQTGTARLVGCMLVNNDSMMGGAIDNQATLTLENCTLATNAADSGGAIINTGTLSMTNCTVYANSAQNGGGLDAHAGTVNIQYSTFHRNIAGGGGGGILAMQPITSRGAIIAGNTTRGEGPDVRGELDSRGYNLVGDRSGATLVPLTGAGPDQSGTAASPLDARLDILLRDNGGPVPTLMPAANSPAVDKGGPSGFPAWDARGAHRPRDGGSGQLLADVGAVELGPIGYTPADLKRALQLAAGIAQANAGDAWLNVDASNATIDLVDCAHLARAATGLD